jgi:gamma-D-glutamyl-L-lysine dipeptidyl-peptidase
VSGGTIATAGLFDAAYAVAVPVTTVWTSPDAPDERYAALVADRPDLAGWCATDAPDRRLALHGRTVTQALLGEPVVVDEQRAGWARVRLPWQPSAAAAGGYPGWVPRHHLSSAATIGAGLTAGLTAVVVAASTTLRQRDPALRAGDVEASLGTVLAVPEAPEPTDRDVGVQLPGGSIATVAASDVLLRRMPSAAQPGAAAEALRLARGLLDTRYFWGGTSRWSVDCSGLVHLTLRAAGVSVPRDASDQWAVLERIDPDIAHAGDLYFFADSGGPVTHVGFASDTPAGGRRPMLHAPELDGRGRVEDTLMSDGLRSRLVGAGRISREAG